MGNWLVVFANSAPQDVFDWRVISDAGKVSARGQSHLSDLNSIKHDKFALVLPGQNVLALRVALKAKNANQLRAIAPFAVEDEVGLDVESQHVSLGLADLNGSFHTACITEKNYLETWLDDLKQVEIAPDKIIPDYLCLPASNHHVSCLNLPDRSIFRFKGWGASFDTSFSSTILQDVIGSAIEKWDLSESETELIYNDWSRDIEDVFDGMAQNAIEEKYSLLQGQFSTKSANSVSGLKVWKTPVGLIAASMLAVTGYNIAEAMAFKSEAGSLKASITNEMKRSFPELKRVVNPRAQLKTLTNGNGQASDFLQLSGLLSAGVREVDGISLDSLRYDARRSEMQASIVYENYEQLTKFKSAIESLGGVMREGGSRQIGNRRAGEITVTL